VSNFHIATYWDYWAFWRSVKPGRVMTAPKRPLWQWALRWIAGAILFALIVVAWIIIGPRPR
jgi:hypothetical protein